MTTVIGPYTAADDTTPAQLALSKNGIESIDTRIVAMDTPGRIVLSYTKRPPSAPEWAWGYSTQLYPDPAKAWVNGDNPDNEIVYTNVHEYGHHWWALFGNRELRKALKALATGTFGPGYRESFAEYFADTFARATTGGRFKGILRHFYKVKCDPVNYAAFVNACLTLGHIPVPPEPPEPPDVVPPLVDPIDELVKQLADEKAAHAVTQGKLDTAKEKAEEIIVL